MGEDVRLTARVTVCHHVEIGARTVIQPGAVIGGDGFGFAQERGRWIKVPQTGTVRIGPDVEIGANTTIDRGAIEDTVIEEGVKLDNLIMVAHNVRVGAHSALAAGVGISGSTTIGRRCMIGGHVGIGGHLTISDDVVITGCTMVSHSVPRPRRILRWHSARRGSCLAPAGRALQAHRVPRHAAEGAGAQHLPRLRSGRG